MNAIDRNDWNFSSNPDDHSRVHLKVEKEGESEFINASHIDVSVLLFMLLYIVPTKYHLRHVTIIDYFIKVTCIRKSLGYI